MRHSPVGVLCGMVLLVAGSLSCGGGKPAAPKVPPLCAAASSCGMRHYCSTAQGCFCIKAAEGDIRCGAVPTTCMVRLCATSADCADLGEGYFCDSPNSGCCTDPPAIKPRCIAPCK